MALSAASHGKEPASFMDQKQNLETYRRMCQEAAQPRAAGGAAAHPSTVQPAPPNARDWYRQSMQMVGDMAAAAGGAALPKIAAEEPPGPAIPAPILQPAPAVAVLEYAQAPIVETIEPRPCVPPSAPSCTSDQPQPAASCDDFFARLLNRPEPPKPASAADLSACGCTVPAPPACGCSQPEPACRCAPEPPACGCEEEIDPDFSVPPRPEPAPCPPACGCTVPAPTACGCSQPEPACRCSPEPPACGCEEEIDPDFSVRPEPAPCPPACGCGAGRRKVEPIRCSLDLPYPEPAACAPSEIQGQMILNCFAGKCSELTAILQYLYDGIHLDEISPEVGNLLTSISKTEMYHFLLLGRLCCSFGVDPKYCAFVKNQQRWWNATPNVLRYSRGIGVSLLANIEGEKQAITQYSMLIEKLTDENARLLIKRIIMDEQLHIDLLSEAFAKYCC